jgi:16S rRNA processing protein RimM
VSQPAAAGRGGASAGAAEGRGSGDWIAIGRILRPRGRKGEVAVEALTDFPGRFGTQHRVYIKSPGESQQQLDIADFWWHQDTLILRFAGVNSIDQAELLRGRLLLIPRSERTRLDPNRYYLWELVGCAVLRRGGAAVGTVADVELTGGVDLLRVRADGAAPGTEDLLIPLAEEICTTIDVDGRRIVIDPPEGLLELNLQAR